MSGAYIEMGAWGKDHWSTLAYIETVMVECGGFQIGLDARMRSNRRHLRVMHQQCPRPKRAAGRDSSLTVAMDPNGGSRLRDGSTVPNHDDWMCVQDMAYAGLFTVGPADVEPGETLHLSTLGRQVASQLREHKAAGGQFADFSVACAA